MRNNQPVTGREIALDDATLIVSKTDLKGRITYVNGDFLRISGFVESELIGQPHNLVRHPDMPVDAFADLWRTLQEGRPWTGYVKNRCKNGDHYWVLANAAPIVEGGKTVGYISVRRRATPEAVAAHEAVYRQFREGRQGKLRLRYGRAVSGQAWSLADVGIGKKLWGGIGVIVAAGAVAVGSSWWGMQETQTRFTGFVTHEQKLLDAYSEMYAQGLQMGQALRNILLDPKNRKAYDNIEQARRDFQAQLEVAQGVGGVNEGVSRDLTAIAGLSSRHFAVHGKVIEAVKAGDMVRAQAILNEEDTPLWREYKKILLDGRQSLRADVEGGRGQISALVSQSGQVSLLAGLLALAIAAATAALLTRTIRRPMAEMDDTFANVLQGNYSNVIDITRNDEIGQAMQGLQILQTRLGFEVSETKRVADEMTRIKIALDNVSTGVMIADPERRIIYANQALTALFTEAEADLRRDLPQFSASALLGSSIDAFHRQPAHQADLLARLDQPHVARIEIGGRHLTVTANPVFNAARERLGTVAEWRDRTNEVAVEREVESLIAGAAEGDFSRRLALAGKSGFFLTVAEGLNGLVQTASDGLGAVAGILDALARGDLSRTMSGEFRGTFGQLQADTNRTVSRLREVVGEIQEAAQAIRTAAHEIASGNQDLSRRTEQQASSLEETSSAMEELNATVRQNAENARRANDLAANSNRVARQGGELVKAVVGTMGDIHASSVRIGDIVGVIDSIAFQTNILALNAAVEAARAGEHGRGFAVVASEVRNLAQRSATAAKEIKQLITESVGKVDAGVGRVNTAGQTMDEVVESFTAVVRLVTEIDHASQEQATGIGQVTHAVAQMDDVTQQNAALVEQAAAAAESLEEQVQHLVAAVGTFSLAAPVAGKRPAAYLPAGRN